MKFTFDGLIDDLHHQKFQICVKNMCSLINLYYMYLYIKLIICMLESGNLQKIEKIHISNVFLQIIVCKINAIFMFFENWKHQVAPKSINWKKNAVCEIARMFIFNYQYLFVEWKQMKVKCKTKINKNLLKERERENEKKHMIIEMFGVSIYVY